MSSKIVGTGVNQPKINALLTMSAPFYAGFIERVELTVTGTGSVMAGLWAVMVS